MIKKRVPAIKALKFAFKSLYTSWPLIVLIGIYSLSLSLGPTITYGLFPFLWMAIKIFTPLFIISSALKKYSNSEITLKTTVPSLQVFVGYSALAIVFILFAFIMLGLIFAFGMTAAGHSHTYISPAQRMLIWFSLSLIPLLITRLFIRYCYLPIALVQNNAFKSISIKSNKATFKVRWQLFFYNIFFIGIILRLISYAQELIVYKKLKPGSLDTALSIHGNAFYLGNDGSMSIAVGMASSSYVITFITYGLCIILLLSNVYIYCNLLEQQDKLDDESLDTSKIQKLSTDIDREL